MDRRRKFWLTVATLYIFVAPLVIVWQNYEIRNAQSDTHALQRQINEGLHKVVPSLTHGQLFLIQQLGWMECAVVSPGSCGPAPIPPPVFPK